MSNRTYERLQLEFIAQNYRAEGYTVEVDVHVSGINFVFDAVARRDGDQTIVLIELISRELSEREMEHKLTALEQAAKRFPQATVDFRYIDTALEPVTIQLQRGARVIPPSELERLLSVRLPAPVDDELKAQRQLLDMWSLHAASIRSVAEFWRIFTTLPIGILDIYDELLRKTPFTAPEVESDDVELDLHQIYDAVQAAVQGVVVTSDFGRNLRAHIVSFRRQVRRYVGPRRAQSAQEG